MIKSEENLEKKCENRKQIRDRKEKCGTSESRLTVGDRRLTVSKRRLAVGEGKKGEENKEIRLYKQSVR